MTATSGSGALSTSKTSVDASRLNGWKLLAPLPDRIGFGGMFAGVLGGRLVAGGGSQFPEKPLWLKGEKAFSDRIFTLDSPGADWAEHPTRLPAPVASAASAATADTIYFAGGLDAQGCLSAAWAMRGRGDDLVFHQLRDLPRAIGYGAAAIVGGRWYVLGGLDSPASKAPGNGMWSLDLARPHATGWRREPDLPVDGVFVAAAASDDRSLYLFGGIGFDATGKPAPSKAALRFDPQLAKWERLADMPEPRVGISAPCPVIGDRFFLVGGYAEVFPGAPREHPGFSAQTLYYQPANGRWSNGPVLPRIAVADRDSPGDVGPAPMIGAPCVVWQDLVVIIGGEVRSSVRTPAVLAWPLEGSRSR